MVEGLFEMETSEDLWAI